MSLKSVLRLSGESELLEGTPAEVDAKRRKALEEELRPARLEAARRSQLWHEPGHSWSDARPSEGAVDGAVCACGAGYSCRRSGSGRRGHSTRCCGECAVK